MKMVARLAYQFQEQLEACRYATARCGHAADDHDTVAHWAADLGLGNITANNLVDTNHDM